VTELLCTRMEQVLSSRGELPPSHEWIRDPVLRTILGTAWIHHRTQRPSFRGEDFGAVDLSGADLFGIHFSQCRLSAMRGSRLTGCSFVDCDLSGADLSASDLSGALLHGSNLVAANLTGVRAFGAEFSWCSTRRSIWIDAHLEGADFWQCDDDRELKAAVG
jgi:uncharacterized protein YjbI with pentapeptide repeats